MKTFLTEGFAKAGEDGPPNETSQGTSLRREQQDPSIIKLGY